jgi:hypothetical protein
MQTVQRNNIILILVSGIIIKDNFYLQCVQILFLAKLYYCKSLLNLLGLLCWLKLKRNQGLALKIKTKPKNQYSFIPLVLNQDIEMRAASMMRSEYERRFV